MAFLPEQARRLAQVHRDYPWLQPELKVIAAQRGVSDDDVEQLAQAEARRKSKRKKKKKGWWSGPLDVVKSVGHAVSDAADFVTPEGVEDFVGKAKDQTVDRVVQSSPIKGAVRYGTAAAATGTEFLDFYTRQAFAAARDATQGDYSGVGDVFETLTNPVGSMFENSDQFTLGQNVLHGESMGSGFVPGGAAVEKQAAAARKFGTIDGHAYTVGRLAASTVFQPGSKPYTLMSGLLDFGAEFADPVGIATGELSKSAKATRGLTNFVSEAGVEAAARKTPRAWRDEVEAVAGLVSGGHRQTTVPAAVDKWLFSDNARKVTEAIAAEPSPSAIWRKMGKKVDATVVKALADAQTPEEVLRVLRPNLGLRLDPQAAAKFRRPHVVPSVQRQVRAFNLMPDTFLPTEDPDALIRNLDNSLANANVMGAERDAILDQAFREVVGSDNPDEQLFGLANVAAEAVRKQMVAHGTPDDLARDLTRWTGSYVRQARYLTDEVGAPVNLPFLVNDAGDPVMGWKPSALYQLLNRGVPLYQPEEVREIRRLTSALTKVGVHTKAVQYPVSVLDFMQNGLWKLAVMVRPAYFLRVNGEEVVRANGSGQFDGALDYLMYAFGNRGKGDIKGTQFRWLDEVDELEARIPNLVGPERDAALSRLDDIREEVQNDMTAFYSAMARQGGQSSADTSMRFKQTDIRQPVFRTADPSAWKRGAAEQILAQSQDPILRRVANGGLLAGDNTPNPLPGLDGIRDWLINGTGIKFRKRAEAAWGVDLTDPMRMDEFLAVQRQHITRSTGDVADLREAIATGRINGRGIGTKNKRGRLDASDSLKERMDTFVAEPEAPMQVDAQVLERYGSGDSFHDFTKAKNALGSFFFGELYGATSDKLARSPVFRKSYYNWIEGHIGWLDEGARESALRQAHAWGLSDDQIRRLTDRANAMPAGTLTLEDADAFAKGVALDEANDLLFDASQRSQFFDIHRIAFPFGEAWKEVTTRWAKLLVSNPKNLRRGSQIVRGLRGADLDQDGVGFFHEDAVTGEEMFSFTIDAPIMDALGLHDVRFGGSVEGLSLGTQVMPGLGPIAQFSVASVLPDVPESDFIARVLFPFGEPETTGAALTTTLIPPVFKKALEAWNADERKDVIYANTLAEVVKQLAASGDYGNSEAEMTRLMSDARGKARLLTGMRAVVQLFAPTAPVPKYYAETEGGDMVSGLLFKRYAELQGQENNGEIDSAVAAFMDEFGDQAFAYLVGKTESTVGGQMASKEYGDWERRNGGFIDTYREVAGYFGPAEEGFDSTTYNRQLRTGKRNRRQAREALSQAQQTVGSWMWRQAKEEAGPKPGSGAKRYLADMKAYIQELYPEWNPAAFDMGRVPERITKIERAVEDPAVADTPLAGAIREYLAARTEAQQAAIDRKYGESTTAFATANKARPLRAFLRDYAASLRDEVPEFGRVFDEVFDPELKDDDAEGDE